MSVVETERPRGDAAISAAPGPKARKPRSRARFNYLGAGFVVALLLLWEIADRVGLINLEFLPSPWEIVVAAGEQLTEGVLVQAVGHTVGVALIGWVIGSVAGIVLGIALGVFRPLWKWTMATVDVFRSLPSIVLLPIALLLYGFSMAEELFLIIWGTIWPVLVAAFEGVRQVPPALLETGATLRLTRTQRILKIILPAALPSTIVGLRLGLTHSFILAIAAEMLGNPAGMGYALMRGQEAMQPGAVFVYILAAGFLGMIFNAIFHIATRLLFPGHAARSGRSRL